MRAQLTVRNDGTTPLKQLALQISSTLQWESATLVNGGQRTRLPLAQHRLDTDADHTGAETEAILPLPVPLAPGTSTSLDLLYAGTVAQSAGRLLRLGANAAQQQATDWDAISPGWTGLRGFGDVLWYPVASPQLFLADGNTLFAAIGHMRLREENAPVRLRLSVEYAGDAPAAAYFCGRREPLKAVADDPDAPVAAAAGIARADFPAEPLGFRAPSLFLIAQPEVLTGGEANPAPGAPLPKPAAAPGISSSSAERQPSATAAAPTPAPATGAPFLALEASDPGVVAGMSAAADRVAPLLREWLGARPLSALTAIDHEGQPFEDGPLLVAPLSLLETSPESSALVQSLTHAWVQTGQPWMDDGLAQFFALLWEEREQGRAAALAQLDELMKPVTLIEPDLTSGAQSSPGQPLIAASEDVYNRRKAAAVWWMLREIVGDGSLHAALSAWRLQPPSHEASAAQAIAFEHLLERLSGKDLGWFFADWVLRDRGLPDLTITDVSVAEEPASPGRANGWFVAVTVRNEGGAVADVPLIVRSGDNRSVQRLRVAGLSTVTQRVLVGSAPSEVIVNDGSTPEVRSSTHSRAINLQVR